MSRCGSSGSSGLSPWKDAGTVNSMLDRDQEPWTTPRGPGTWLPILRENLIYTGISTDPLYAVGPMGSNARVTRLSGTDFNLPHLVSSPSAAYGIVSNASLIVGSSKNHSTGNLRPVAWEGSGTTYTAKDVGGSLTATWAGEAYGANFSNQVVGQFEVLYTGGWSGAAAFRSKSGTTVQYLAFNSATGVGDILYAPGKSGVYNLTARALSAKYSGRAVGWYDAPGPVRQAVSWSASALGSDSVAISMGAWEQKVGSLYDTHSIANGVNNGVWALL